jgi:hypothetical protein
MAKLAKRSGHQAGASRASRLRAWLTDVGDGRRRLGMSALRALVVVLGIVGLVAGLRLLRRHVLQTRYRGSQGRAAVQLTRTPRWMPEALAWHIVEELTPRGASLADADLAQTVYERAAANPWVQRVGRVRVRPNTDAPGGVVRCELTFRRPAARVRVGSRHVYVDAEGVRLPISHVPLWVVTLQDERGQTVRQVSYLARGQVPDSWRSAARRIHYVTIDGVSSPPPPPGWKWNADDLAAGLRLVALVRPRAYYAQISLIDVRNHAGRITRDEPALRMYAQIGRGRPTDIRFGRFPAPGGGDYIIGPQRKLSYLDEYAAEHGGRLAGEHAYLDLRYDELHVSIN